MANPSILSVAITTRLQNLSLQYRNRNYIADRIFPVVVVPSMSVKILKYGKANMFRRADGEDFHAEGSKFKRLDYQAESTFATPKDIGFEESVTDEMLDIVNQEGGSLPIEPLVDAVQHVTNRIDLEKEVKVANCIYQNAWVDGTVGGTSVGGNWSSTSSTTNTFISDIFNAKSVVRKSTGVKPNKLLLDYSTFLSICANCPQILDRIKYTQTGVLTEQLIAELLQIDEVIVGDAIYSIQKESKNSTSGSNFKSVDIWDPTNGKGSAFLFYQEAPSLRSLMAGVQFRLPYMGALRYVKGYREEATNSTVMQVVERVEIAPLAQDVGYAFTRCIA